ncbi:MAG: Bax inhibitor-1 family protein [Betaproteobacteria bacterium]|nr:Bax inhibitor-1 family protein [Betaproteobacteria bacterium]
MQPELQPARSAYQAQTSAQEIAVQQQRVLRNTYLLLALTMVPTVIGAFIGMRAGGVIFAYPVASSLIMIAVVIGLQFAIVANRNSGLGVVLLLAMTGLLGWWLGPLLAVALSLKNGPQLIGLAAGGTAGVMLVMAVIATTVRKDFSFMGRFLFVGMIVLLLALIANLFLQIPALALTISALVVVVFSLFLLHDLSRIVNGGETNYIIATTGVYLSLFNIFANLLQLLMALTGERD